MLTRLDRWNALRGWHDCEPPRNHFGYHCFPPTHSHRRWELFNLIGGITAFLINAAFFTAQVVTFRIDWYDWIIGGAGLSALVAAVVFGWLPGWRRTWGDPVWRTLREAGPLLISGKLPEDWQPSIFDDLPPTDDPGWQVFNFALTSDKLLNCSYHRDQDILMVTADWLEHQLLRLR